MVRAISFFGLAAVLSAVPFYGKSEHSLDYYLVVPVGLYFIAALLLTFRPKVPGTNQLKFAGLALVLWLVLYSVSYNLLFFVIAPLAGGLGAWLIVVLCQRFLGLSFHQAMRPVILTGVVTAVLGVLFMILVREMPKEIFTMGLKAGVLTGFWQLGVGVALFRAYGKLTSG